MLLLNIDKCAVISFSSKKKYLFTHTKQFQCFFNSKLSFDLHADYIRNKSFIKLGLLKYMCKDFNDEYALKILLVPLVKLHFDYYFKIDTCFSIEII